MDQFSTCKRYKMVLYVPNFVMSGQSLLYEGWTVS